MNHPRKPRWLVAMMAVMLLLMTGLAAVAGYSFWKKYRDERAARRGYGAPAEPELGIPVGDFTLTERSGEAFRAADLKGQVWVASFFFSTCGGECIILNNAIAELLSERLTDVPVKFVSITVKPNHDKPAILKKYGDERYIEPNRIDPAKWLFLTDPAGKDETIASVCRRFQLAYGRDTHSSRLVLVDAEGKVQGYFDSNKTSDLRKLERKIRQLTAESTTKTPATEAAAKESA